MHLKFILCLFFLLKETTTLPSSRFYTDDIAGVGPLTSPLDKRPPITELKPYIQGGVLVEGREFPWVASLRVFGYHLCGVNIVNSEWVLGVASCMFNNWDSYTVEAGTNSLDTGGTIHNVIEVVIHEKYNESDSWINDITLLKVHPPIVLGNGISPVVLAEKGQVTPAGTSATIAGWGALKYFHFPSNDLHKIEVEVSDHKQCEEAYAPIPKKVVYPTQICAASKIYLHGATNGDSAAPLTVDGKVVGLVSWSRKDNRPGYPTVYTEVSHYLDWISEHMKY